MTGFDLQRDITAVVTNWETPEHTIRCVRRLIDDGMPAARIVVVDNGSQDDSPARLRAALPECRLVRMEKNTGYALATRTGVAALPGEAYLVVNNDAFVHRPGALHALLEALERDDQVGIVVPRLLNPDLTLQATVKPLDTPAVALARASGLSRLIPNRWQPRWGTHWDHSTSRLIRAVDGAVMLIRRRTWDESGGFGAQTSMYAEDTRICWEAFNHGWKIWFEANAEFVHLGNATARRLWSDPERAERWSTAEANLLREQLSRPSAALAVGFTAAGLAGRTVAFTLLRRRDRAADARAQLRGYLAGFR